MDVLRNGSLLAVSGYKDSKPETFIDLFALTSGPDFQRISLVTTLQPCFSKEFTDMNSSLWQWRCVCLVDDSVFVTCFRDRIESYNTSRGFIKGCHFTGKASCMTTREGRIYVALLFRADVIVFDRMLRKIDTITLKGLVTREYPGDMTVYNNRLFICTDIVYGRALMYNSNSDIEQEYEKPSKDFWTALSTTISEENELIYTLWNCDGLGKCVVVVYALPAEHTFLLEGGSTLHGGQSSLCGSPCLASFNVSDDSLRIRINDNVNRLFISGRTGEVYEYHAGRLFKNLLKPVEEKENLVRQLRAAEENNRQLSEKLKKAEEEMTYYNQIRDSTEREQNSSFDSFKHQVAHATLRADYGRLLVDVANDLTLDSTLQLAYLFDLPPAERDMLLRNSSHTSPGISFINYLETRNIINMYDVTNLRKGLEHLHMYKTNEKYIIPYQQKADPFQLEENQLPELIDWLDERTEALNAPLKSDEKEEAKSKDDPDGERLVEESEISRLRQDSQTIVKRQPYIEHMVNHKGGNIAVVGVHLSIPDDALRGDHVIAVTVIHDPDIHLPGDAGRRRMTPLIKLEPANLNLNKSARLTIPHSAIIPEPHRHSVTVFSGQTSQGKVQGGQIIWKEEKSIKQMLEHETISIDINVLCYISVCLVSKEMEQKHVFRVVPFIDGIAEEKEDVLITVCFCKDSEADYQMLLQDQTSKLTLGGYTTFQVSRALRGKDTNSHIVLAMIVQGDKYLLSKESAKKFVEIDHLCAASRVTHQFRLTKYQDGAISDAMIDVELKLSQGEKNQTALILQSKVKDILLSPLSQSLLNRQSNKDLQHYEDMRKTVSRMLTKDHCEKLAEFFKLTKDERDQIRVNKNPGMVLIEILDNRKLIMSDKMFDLYEGLRKNKLDRIGRHVMKYIEESRKEMVETNDVKHDDGRKANEKIENLQESDIKMTRNVELLMAEGFKRLDVQRALKLSRSKLDLGRRILLLAKDDCGGFSSFPGSSLYREHYMDQHGGELHIAGVHLRVPAGALNTGRIISLGVSVDPTINGPVSNESLRLVPFVKFGPEDIIFDKPVNLIIPHCAMIPSEQRGLAMYTGVAKEDKTIKWDLRSKQFTCLMHNHHLEVKLQKPCLIGPHVPYHSKIRKQICVVPILKRISTGKTESTICLWFFNDEKVEYDSLIYDEVYKTNGIEIHDPVCVLLESMSSTLSVNVKISTPQCFLQNKNLDIHGRMLWLQNRHVVELRLQNKSRQDTIHLEIELIEKPLKQLSSFNIKLKVKDLLDSSQVISPFQVVLPNTIMEAFKQLKQRLSEKLNAEQSSQIANIFHLREDVISNIKRVANPGFLLFKTLDKNSLISAANVSTLESALTEQGNEDCVFLVRYFRMRNPVVEATLCKHDND